MPTKGSCNMLKRPSARDNSKQLKGHITTFLWHAPIRSYFTAWSPKSQMFMCIYIYIRIIYMCIYECIVLYIYIIIYSSIYIYTLYTHGDVRMKATAIGCNSFIYCSSARLYHELQLKPKPEFLGMLCHQLLVSHAHLQLLGSSHKGMWCKFRLGNSLRHPRDGCWSYCKCSLEVQGVIHSSTASFHANNACLA